MITSSGVKKKKKCNISLKRCGIDFFKYLAFFRLKYLEQCTLEHVLCEQRGTAPPHNRWMRVSWCVRRSL